MRELDVYSVRVNQVPWAAIVTARQADYSMDISRQQRISCGFIAGMRVTNNHTTKGKQNET